MTRTSSMLGMALLLAGSVELRAEEVSTRPPDLYAEKIAAHLTPVEKVLGSLPRPPADAEDGWVLLDEDLQYVMPDGRRIMVRHRASKALTDGGAESIGREERHFRRTTQRAHLVLARTILPDGKMQNVKPEAIFIQTPQRDADDALYDDSAELVVIFPNAKAGAVTEWIVVTEEMTPRIPDHFTSVLSFDLGWPTHLLRRVVELPDQMSARLKTIAVGSGVPEPRIEAVKEGRTRLTWESEDTASSRDEPLRAPFMQTGPLVRLSTLKDWAEFLRWYVPLANRRIALGKNLAADVDTLTKNARTPREVLNTLTAQVANEVRYVGMEFGSSDLEPHAVSEVWEHQYGDCKDKASLLRAMLAHKGITAHLALVSATHLGLVDKRVPDFRDFNHVILVLC